MSHSSRLHSPSSRLEGIDVSLIRQVFDAAPPDAINLGLGEPMFETPLPIVTAAREALDRPCLGYTPNAGLPELRVAIADAHRSSPESVCVTVGAAEALMITMLAWLQAGDEVLVPDPGYPSYAAVARLAGARPVPYLLSADDGFAFDAARLRPLLTTATAAIVINSPSNPTGTVISYEELKQVAELAEDHGLVVISDEVYREIYFGERPASFLDVSKRGFVIGGLSKSAAMTGWRLGWVIGPAEHLWPVEMAHQYAVTCAPALSQRAALAAFSPEVSLAMQVVRAELREQRELMARLVAERLTMPFHQPTGAFYMLVQAVPPGRSSLDMALDLARLSSVITAPGSAFGEVAAQWLRLSFCGSQQDIRAGIDRIAAGIHSC